MQRRTAIAALICATAGAALRPDGRAGAAELGAKHLAGVLLRILAYDRNVKARSNGKSIPILIVYLEGNQTSETTQSDVTGALEDLSGTVTVAGLRVQVSALAFSSINALDARIAATRPVAMFVCTGLADAVPALAMTARKRSVLTMTLSTAYLKAGLSIGLTTTDDRVNILVNLPAARAEGADLDVDLLRIAEVYR